MEYIILWIVVIVLLSLLAVGVAYVSLRLILKGLGLLE